MDDDIRAIDEALKAWPDCAREHRRNLGMRPFAMMRADCARGLYLRGWRVGMPFEDAAEMMDDAFVAEFDGDHL